MRLEAIATRVEAIPSIYSIHSTDEAGLGSKISLGFLASMPWGKSAMYMFVLGGA